MKYEILKCDSHDTLIYNATYYNVNQTYSLIIYCFEKIQIQETYH